MVAEERPLSEVFRHSDVRIPVLGETVGAMRYEPVDVDQPRPTILMYVPYPKDDMITYGAYDHFNRFLAARGYDVVVADMIGSGSSSGAVDEMFIRREGKEGAAIVEWLADQPWSNGRVGMYGKSYGGITALDTAARRPEHLDAIVPIHTPYQGLRNAYTYGGLFELLTIGMDWLSLMQVLETKPPSKHHVEKWGDIWKQRLDHHASRDPWLIQFFRNAPEAEYWADKDIPVEDIEVPTLAVGGWRDSYTLDTVQYFEAIDAPKRLLLGPWRHTMPHVGRESKIDFRNRVLDWFDRFLKDVDNDTMDGSACHVWTELDGGGKVEAGEWRGLDEWPTVDSPGTETITFELTPEGLSRPGEDTEGTVDTRYSIDYTVGMHSIDPYGVSVAPQDTSPDDARSMTFETDPLSAPIDYTGTGRAVLRLETDDPNPTISVRIVDVSPDGTGTLVTHGTMRASNRGGLRSPEPLDPGEEHEIDVPLDPKSHVFEAGHRIRVSIAGSFFPEVLPTGDAEIFHLRSSPENPSVVEFPGMERADLDFENAIDVPEPERGHPSGAEWVTGSDATWKTSRERTENRASVEKTNQYRADLPHVSFTRDGTYEASIRASDPDSLIVENDLEIGLEYPDEEVTVRAVNRFDREVVQVTSRVEVDGRTVFEERWLD